MATIIDALIVTLGLDPADWRKGQEEATRSAKKTADEASRVAKDMEARGAQAAQFFGQIRNQVLGLFAVFTAGRGMEEFARDTTATNAATGRLAHNLGVTTESLSTWQGAIERVGGSSAEAQASIQSLVSQFENIKLTGTGTPEMIKSLQLLNVTLDDLGDPDRAFKKINEGLSKKDPREAVALGARMGMSQSMVNLMEMNPKALNTLLDQERRLVAISQADAAASMEVQSAWTLTGQASGKLGRTLLTDLAPALLWVNDRLMALVEWAQGHAEVVHIAFIGLASAAGILTLALAAPYAGIMLLTAGAALVGAALALLYEDWSVWTEGGKSEFGSFYQYVSDQWSAYGGMVRQALGDAWAIVKDALSSLLILFTGNNAEISKAWSSNWDDMTRRFKDFSDNIAKIASDIGARINDAIRSKLPPGMLKIWDFLTKDRAIPNYIGKPSDDPKDVLNRSYGGDQASGTDEFGHPVEQLLPQDDDSSNREVLAGNGVPRGIRNNNPGNLNFAGQAGATKESGPHARFAVFPTMEAGIEALGRQLKSYAAHGLDTIRTIIQKYAPSSENQTGAYIAQLSGLTGAGADDRLNLNDPALLKRLEQGIISVENGKKWASVVNNGGATHTSTSETHIDKIEVHTAAKDADGIARGIGKAIKQNGLVDHMNYGLA